MTSNNFYIYTDSSGYLPVLTRNKIKYPPHHNCYVKYINNTPVEVKPYKGQTKVYDYKLQEYVDISTIASIKE